MEERFYTKAEIIAVGPERPRESQEDEGGSERPRIGSTKECGRIGPSTPNAKRMADGPERPRESREEEVGGERTWPGAEKRKGKDEAGKATEGEAMTGQEN